MMGFLSTLFLKYELNLQFMLELLLCCMIYVIPLDKREHALLRGAAGVLLCFIVALCLPAIVNEEMSPLWLMLSSVVFASEFVAVSLFAWFVCRITFYGALFCGGCAYATQHFAYSLFSVVRQLTGLPLDSFGALFLVYIPVLFLFYLLFARHLPERKRYNLDVGQSIVSVLLVVAVVFVLSTMSQEVGRAYGEEVNLVSHLYAMFCCGFLLWAQVSLRRQNHLESELEVQHQLWHKQEEQYQASRKNIEIINRKCHDLKYQLAALRLVQRDEERSAQLDEIEKAIQIYDTSRKSGNEVLDTVLTEKALYCEAHGINMTCVADGRQLSFMDAADIYSIFGNALDNAIECAERLEDADHRLIAITVWTRSDLLLIQIENYCEGQLTMKDGLPVTTKRDAEFHGFGMKSIRYTAEKYGGVMSVSLEDQLFILRVTIPTGR